MIRQQVGDVLEIQHENHWFYIIVLTKIEMFGGNIVFAFFNDGRKMSLDDLININQGFNICTDIILYKRDGLVNRIGKVNNLEKYLRTKYFRSTFTDKSGKRYGYWFIYHMDDLTTQITRVKKLPRRYKNAIDRVTYEFSTVTMMILNKYKPTEDNYLYIQKTLK